MKGKSHKIFYVIVSQSLSFQNLFIWGGGAADR